ncbi:MAG: VIT family protein [Xanthomonadaceae bacterium]|jgi:VIT1/CCC1 family predicted Fe2+/Mn2+ transporter|nr:VIT family protein [Xanthomonadaceae bacterium]
MSEEPTPYIHTEHHRSHRSGWLRAAVLGANDGIVSIAGIVVGITASGASHETILIAGIAGTVAGAMSMAAAEYVSVQSQADIEEADMAQEQRELHNNPHNELEELTWIYQQRGLDHALARQVAEQLTAKDALQAHARDELGITETLRARPLQAAAASAAAFCFGAVLPVLATLLTPRDRIEFTIVVTTILGLLASGAFAAWAGGAPILRGAIRVGFWGALAMAATSIVGRLLHTHIA